jgi:hypothetical protein
MMPRWICLLAVTVLTVSCQSPSPKVSVVPGASIAGRELVVFTFGNAWLANHSMVRALHQELARRGMAVKLSIEPWEKLRPDALVLHLEQAGETKEPGGGRIDFLSFLKFSLRDSAGNELAEVSYSGRELDKLEQKALAKEILDRLLAGS